MSIRCVILSLFIIVGITPAFAKKKSTPLPMPPHATATDRSYVSALAAGNHLLQAWQTGDHEAALLLLTDRAKRGVSAEQLEKMFSPEPPAERAYQIARGRKLRTGRYVFPVTLYETTGPHTPLHTRSSQIIVLQSGKDDWAIDKLP